MAGYLQANFHVSLHQMVQAIVTILAVINPVVCGSIFLVLTPNLPPMRRRLAAVKVAVSILIIFGGVRTDRAKGFEHFSAFRWMCSE